MWISSLRYDLWPSPKRASSPTPVHVAGTRTKRFRDRGPNAIPPHERLLLVVLLLVVAGWIIFAFGIDAARCTLKPAGRGHCRLKSTRLAGSRADTWPVTWPLDPEENLDTTRDGRLPAPAPARGTMGGVTAKILRTMPVPTQMSRVSNQPPSLLAPDHDRNRSAATIAGLRHTTVGKAWAGPRNVGTKSRRPRDRSRVNGHGGGNDAGPAIGKPPANGSWNRRG